jgi:hypothetical protein
MKSRPNTDQFSLKKDPTDFLNGGAADAADVLVKPASPPAPIPVVVAPATFPSARVHREQKVFRLPVDLIAALKREAYERSVKAGGRVTETDLVEQALKAYLSV